MAKNNPRPNPGKSGSRFKSPPFSKAQRAKQAKSGAGANSQQPPINFPPLINGVQIANNPLPLPPVVIHGVLSRGEKLELAGGSKTFKTFALIDQTLSIASGVEWWGFKTEPTPVIYLNLEIPQAFFESRVRDVAQARGIAIPANFNVWHLRGQRLYQEDRWLAFLQALKDAALPYPHPLVTSDPIYKLLGGRNENAAGDVQTLLEQLEDVVQLVDGANSFGHHYTKGNQASKEAIDRASGSGVFQRDPDSLFPMTRHEKDDAFIIEPILRNHPPIKPFVVEWQYPLFEHNPALDPGALKQPKKPGPAHKYKAEDIRDQLKGDMLTTAELRKRVMDNTGMSKTTFYDLLKEAEKLGMIAKDGITDKWERVARP